MSIKEKSRTYLDHAASTPVDARVLRAITPYFSEKFGNPGSLHSFGQEAIAAVDKARETVAGLVGAQFREVVFTASATESNNLALRGVVKIFMEENKGVAPKVIVAAMEHESVIETARDLERAGAEVVFLPVDRGGIADLGALRGALDERTAIVSIMYVNNEIGAVEPIAEAAKIVREFREGRTSRKYPLFHTDAAQAFQFFDCNVQELGVDLMTLSSQKIYGPKGAGALYVRGAAAGSLRAPATQMSGGGQEFGLRSGTENVPAIVGFARAAELLRASRPAANKKIAALRDELWRGIKKMAPGAALNGPKETHAALRAPHILNVHFPDHLAEDVVTKCDLLGLAVSSGSACRSRAMEASYVIEALGYGKERARESVRFSLGRPTSGRDVKAALAILKKAIL